MPKTPEAKVCATCGREFEYRKKWKANWAEVRYCSDRCRQAKSTNTKLDYSAKILELLEARGAGKTICPSECLDGEQKQDRELMEKVRECARLLAHAGKIEITQKGQVVDPTDFRGPIRLRKKR